MRDSIRTQYSIPTLDTSGAELVFTNERRGKERAAKVMIERVTEIIRGKIFSSTIISLIIKVKDR